MNIVLMQTKPHDARVNVKRSNMKLSSIKKLIRSESNLLITSETFNMYSKTTHIPNSVLDFWFQKYLQNSLLVDKNKIIS